ncbi:MAG TPA: TonB family protein [Terriglobia bacterium]|nr:TonB family protein [Terriglobia bacterium]
MLFENDEDLELQPKRTKTLIISLGIHLALVVFLIFNPDLLTSPPKRVIKVMGQDYDLSKEDLTELVIPPEALRPKPAVPDKPLVQPDAPKPEPQPTPQPQQTPPPPQATPPQPPPPPPPPKPQPQTPPPVIGPDDVIKEGARPDAQPKGSRGDTREQARNGQQGQQQQPGQPEQPLPPRPDQSKQQQAQSEKQPPLVARNTNPNAIRVPGGNIMDSVKQTVQQQIDEDRRRTGGLQGPRTGTPAGQEDPNFSTEEPTILSDTKGYDFGPYLNQVIIRVRDNWYSLIPEIARINGRRGKVVIIFTITKGGTIANLRIAANSGTDALDRAAYGAISFSNPFARLPNNFDGDHLDLQFTFLYNIR